MIKFIALLCFLNLVPIQENVVIAKLDIGKITSAGVGGLVWSPDGKMLAFPLDDGMVLIWSLENNTSYWIGEVIDEFAGYDIAWSSNDEYIAWTANTDIAVWHNTQPPTISYLSGEHTDFIVGIAFSPDSSLLASVANVFDRSVIVWDMETNAPVHRLELDEAYNPSNVAFRPNGTNLAISRFSGSIELWDVESEERLNIFDGLPFEISSIVWSPDGDVLAASEIAWLGLDDGDPRSMITIAAWDVESSELLYMIEEMSKRRAVYGVYKIAVNPNGKWLASSTMSGEIHLWDFKSGELLDTLEGHTDYVFDLAWSPDGQMLASVSADNTVIVWDSSLILSD